MPMKPTYYLVILLTYIRQSTSQILFAIAVITDCFEITAILFVTKDVCFQAVWNHCAAPYLLLSCERKLSLKSRSELLISSYADRMGTSACVSRKEERRVNYS